MTKSKYQVRKNEGFAACVSEFSVLCSGRIVYRTNDHDDATAFVRRAVASDRANDHAAAFIGSAA
jgi:hypothetical protein